MPNYSYVNLTATFGSDGAGRRCAISNSSVNLTAASGAAAPEGVMPYYVIALPTISKDTNSLCFRMANISFYICRTVLW